MAHIPAQLQASQLEIENRLLKRIADFESQLQSSPATTDSLARLTTEFHTFRDLVWEILRHLRKQMADCLGALDGLEMRSRRKALLISGIPELVSDVPGAVQEIIRDRLNLPEAAMHLVQCHRLGEKVSQRPRPVLIRCSSHFDKLSVWRKKTLLKGTPYAMSEFLTRSRQTVFTAARSHFGMRNCWTQDGVIVVKLSENTKRRLTTQSELDELMKVCPSANAPSTAADIPRTSSAITPSLKSAAGPSRPVKGPETRRQAAKK